jgi:hypothetical protein
MQTNQNLMNELAEGEAVVSPDFDGIDFGFSDWKRRGHAG